jgi:hypothetical protein
MIFPAFHNQLIADFAANQQQHHFCTLYIIQPTRNSYSASGLGRNRLTALVGVVGW